MFGTLISSVTVGAGGAATISFSSIPQTYTDLTLLVSGRSDAANSYVGIKFNGSATSDYSIMRLIGTGSAASSSSGSSLTSMTSAFVESQSADTANTFGNSQIFIPNYALTVAKTISADGVSENNAAGAFQFITAGLRTTTDAITSITLTPGSGNFAQYSTAYLYGTLKGSGGATAA